jgi:hypothetical protein
VLLSQLAARDPRYAPVVLVLAVAAALPGLMGRWRMRKLFLSGDVERVLGAWQGSFLRVPHRDTMAPLLQATAYASYGLVDSARRSLERAAKGPAWEMAIEQRLFVETLLDSFEGDRDAAVRKAQALESMPVAGGTWLTRRRVTMLRGGLAALARAFAHSSRAGDERALARAAGVTPLVHWAMRYAAAIVAIDAGRRARVPVLLSGAPSWPQESAFHGYHVELLERARA